MHFEEFCITINSAILCHGSKRKGYDVKKKIIEPLSVMIHKPLSYIFVVMWNVAVRAFI